MKIKVFDRKKYIESINLLIKRNAPNYVIEAYNQGFTKVINLYYASKLNRATSITESKRYKVVSDKLDSLVEKANHLSFIKEAKNYRDEDFLKAFFVMTNLDIITGKKLPPNAGNLLKDAGMYNIGLKNIYKKARKENKAQGGTK